MLQKGFATLEVILMVLVIGILASIAVPRFANITTSANTAKIQSDLSTIDTAIAIYEMENGALPASPTLETLKDYLQDYANIKPPTGKANLSDGTEYTIPDNPAYSITNKGTTEKPNWRATLGEHTAGEFTKKKTTTTTSGG